MIIDPNTRERPSGPLLLRIEDAYIRHRFAFLFYTLLLTIGAGPVVEALLPRFDGFLALLALNLVAAVFGVLPRRYARPAIVLGTVFIALRPLRGAFGNEALNAAGDIAWILVCVPAAAIAVRYALKGADMDRERVFAALDGYLIAGLVFGIVYARVEEAWPGSLAQSVAGPMTPMRAIYFSFVTLVTLGYGDIVPATDTLRGVVLLEALGGHLYVAVLIARLVSLYTIASSPPPKT